MQLHLTLSTVGEPGLNHSGSEAFAGTNDYKPVHSVYRIKFLDLRVDRVQKSMQYGQMIHRLLTKVLMDTPKSVLLLGPRQVGKSTLMNALRPDLTLNLGDENTFLRFKSNPEALLEFLGGGDYRLVLIDEVQKHPDLLNTLQVIIDRDKLRGQIKTRFLLTGSSARKLKRGHANLLPGRLFVYRLGPLCAAELDYRLDCHYALAYGCLPEPYLNKNPEFSEKFLTSYSATYLKEEIQAEALTRNLSGFSRFLLSAAAMSGHALDYSKLAKQAKVDRKSCGRFYEILEDTLIATRLDVFDRTQAEIVKRPKYYFFDTGVLNGLLENFLISSDRKGVLFEHLVLNQIIASAQARDIAYKLSYFRTRSGYEVDLIFEIRNKIYAIEIKSGQVGSTDATKLLRMKSYIPHLDRLFILTLDKEKRRIKDVEIMDLPSFLTEIGL